MIMLVLVSVIDMVMAQFTHEMFSSSCKYYVEDGDSIPVLLMSQWRNVYFNIYVRRYHLRDQYVT
jgi:hypothetical protein